MGGDRSGSAAGRAASAAKPLALALLAAATWWGWREFWFLTDDAFITFRYVSNHVSGWGYTWNPPPFRPVEGYSNFLWMVLLEGIWRVTGVEPPRSCNAVSLAFSYGTLAIAFLMVLRLELPPALARGRFLWAVVALAATISNRTFLAWTSSGLESALFVFCVAAWVLAALEHGRRPAPGRLFACALAASAMALTRPDGLLAVAATGVLGLEALLARPPRLRWLAAVPGLSPVAAHLTWRRWYYGEWVPNTWFAKQVGAWPESGLRYAASFVLEYAIWVWLLLALAAAVVLARRPRQAREAAIGWSRAAVAGFLAGHFLYYTLIVGGDHFEYRVYAHLVPLLWVSTVALLGALGTGPREAFALAVLALALSLPLPWVHHARNQQTFEWRQGPVADAFPAGPLRLYAEAFDQLQGWLEAHGVCVRQQPHRAFALAQLALMPAREQGARVPPAGFPVLRRKAVGVPAWVYPNLAILDELGLNDRVIARTPPAARGPGERVMAHDRSPPPGYVECFAPDVRLGLQTLVVEPRARPLTGEAIRRCEAAFDRGFRGQQPDDPRPAAAPAEAVELLPDVARLAAAAGEPELGAVHLLLGRDPPEERDRASVESSPLSAHLAELCARVERDGRDAGAWEELGASLLRAGRTLEAIAALERALEVRPGSARARDALRWATDEGWRVGPLTRARQLIDSGEPGPALPLLRRLARIEPENALAFAELGDALARLGRNAEAVATLRRAVELEPGFAEARERLARAEAAAAGGAAPAR